MCGKVLETGQCVGSSVLIKERPKFQTSPSRFHRRLALNKSNIEVISLSCIHHVVCEDTGVKNLSQVHHLRILSKSAVLFFAKGGITLQINIGPEKRKNYVFEIGIYVFV